MEELALAALAAVAPSDTPGTPLTYEDYVALTPPDNGNYELHDGKIIAVPSPTPQHQRTARRLSTRLDNFLSKNPKGELFFCPVGHTLR